MNILIIDQSILFTEGIKCILDSYELNIQTFYAEDIPSAIQLIEKKGNPELIFLDINMFEGGNLLAEKLKYLMEFAPVVIISEIESPSLKQMAMEAGASGFLSKSTDRNILFDAIEVIRNGGIYNNIHIQDELEKKEKVAITERQYQILLLLSKGLLNKQIASELNISINTVSTHLHEIFRKLNVTNRTAAVQNAYKFGII